MSKNWTIKTIRHQASNHIMHAQKLYGCNQQQARQTNHTIKIDINVSQLKWTCQQQYSLLVNVYIVLINKLENCTRNTKSAFHSTISDGIEGFWQRWPSSSMHFRGNQATTNIFNAEKMEHYFLLVFVCFIRWFGMKYGDEQQQSTVSSECVVLACVSLKIIACNTQVIEMFSWIGNWFWRAIDEFRYIYFGPKLKCTGSISSFFFFIWEKFICSGTQVLHVILKRWCGLQANEKKKQRNEVKVSGICIC